MKLRIDGKWKKGVSVKDATGYRADRIRMNESDLAALARMSDADLAATVRQLAGRVNREHSADLYPFQRKTLDWLMGGGFHSGGVVRSAELRKGEVPVVMSTQTGRQPSWPEMQFFPGTRTGRWPSKCPARAQEPRGPIPNEIKVTIPKTSGIGKSESALLGMDFSEIEKRVALHYGIDRATMDRDAAKKTSTAFEMSARRFGKTEAQRVREAYRTAFTPIWQECLDAVVREAIKGILDAAQTRIDEEGCGAAMAAIKEWKE